MVRDYKHSDYIHWLHGYDQNHKIYQKYDNFKPLFMKVKVLKYGVKFWNRKNTTMTMYPCISHILKNSNSGLNIIKNTSFLPLSPNNHLNLHNQLRSNPLSSFYVFAACRSIWHAVNNVKNAWPFCICVDQPPSRFGYTLQWIHNHFVKFKALLLIDTRCCSCSNLLTGHLSWKL